MAMKKEDLEKAAGKQAASSGLKGTTREGVRNRGDLKKVTVRLYENDIAALEDHFADRGLKLTIGLRMVIMDYMADNV